MSATSSPTAEAPKVQAPTVAPVPRLALNVEEACAALGLSWKAWREHVEPHVKMVRVGRCKRVSVAELERWLAAHGDRAGDVMR